MQANTKLPEIQSSIRQAHARKSMNTVEAASYLGLCESSLRKDRTKREPQIPFARILGRVVYYADQLDEFISRQTVGLESIN